MVSIIQRLTPHHSTLTRTSSSDVWGTAILFSWMASGPPVWDIWMASCSDGIVALVIAVRRPEFVDVTAVTALPRSVLETRVGCPCMRGSKDPSQSSPPSLRQNRQQVSKKMTSERSLEWLKNEWLRLEWVIYTFQLVSDKALTSFWSKNSRVRPSTRRIDQHSGSPRSHRLFNFWYSRIIRQEHRFKSYGIRETRRTSRNVSRSVSASERLVWHVLSFNLSFRIHSWPVLLDDEFYQVFELKWVQDSLEWMILQ